MSRLRKFIGFWIVLIVLGLLLPGAFYVAGRSLDAALRLPPLLPEPYNVFPAAFALVVGLFWAFWSYSYLHFVGRGSPIEAFGVALYPTRTLVTSGPYAYTRNPMALGVLFILAGIAFLMNSISALILIPILAMLAIAYLKRFEEPALARRFGEEYMEYRRSVPMLIPGPRP